MRPPTCGVLLMAHSSLFLANAILGVGSVVSKMGLEGMNPVLFGLLREALAAPLLFLLSLVLERAPKAAAGSTDAAELGGSSADTRSSVLTLRDALQFLLAGTMLFGTNVLYIVGVKFLGATSAAIWQSSLPIFTTLLGVLAGYESLSAGKAVGVALAFAGCIFVSLFDPNPAPGAGDKESSSAQLGGNLIFLVQVIACSAFFVAEKPLLRRWTPLATLAYSYAIASILMLITGLIVNFTPALLHTLCPDCHGHGWGVPREAMLAVGYWVLLGSTCGYFLLTWGNLHVDASMVGVYFTVQPIGAAVASVAVIAVTPPPHYGLQGPGLQDLGAIGIFCGVGMLIFDARRSGATKPSQVDSSQVGSSRVGSSRAILDARLRGGTAAGSAHCGTDTHGQYARGLPASLSASQRLLEPPEPQERAPISASSSHDSILLAARLAAASRSPHGIGGSLSASVDELPHYYHPLPALDDVATASGDAHAVQGTAATPTARSSMPLV